MVTTRPSKTIVKPTALGPVANTDTQPADLWSISKGPSFGTGRAHKESFFGDALLLEELMIVTVELQKLIVRSSLNDPAFAEN